MRHRFVVSTVVAAVTVLTGTASATTPPSTPSAATSPAVPAGPRFGSLASPCGPAGAAGTPTFAEGQNGGETLKLGTATDKGYEARALNPEMYDTAVAFAKWCNEQGGIRGLKLEIVDLDGKLFNVPAAMETACAETFAMVGGGWVFDDQMFPRFHECKMVAFPGYSVTAAATSNNAKVEAMPNPLNDKPASWWLWAKANYPEAITKMSILYTDFLTTQIQLRSVKAQLEAIGGYTVIDEIPTSPTGEANWAPFAQRLKDKGAQAVHIVGSTNTALSLMKSLREIDYAPQLVILEAPQYDAEMVVSGNAEATAGVMIRSAFVPFEESFQPAMASYLDMMTTHNKDGKLALLGLQSTSAFLLFATAANACLDANNNVLERECVLAAARKITSWTAGGLHAETNPGANKPPSCGMIITVKDGGFARHYPQAGSADDSGNGFHCDGDAGVVHVEGDFGDSAPGIDPSRDQ